MLRAVWIAAFSLFVCYAAANTEKLMFTAGERPCPETSSTSIAILSPPHTTIERVKIRPGTQHLFTLKDLEPGMRYEARISYPATSPTDFSMTLEDDCLLRVEAIYAGVSNIQGMENAPVTFDIVLENLYLGFLFYQVYKVVIAIVLVLVFGQFIVIPKVRSMIKQHVDSHDKDK
ncbi:hypothetical protein RO3G_13478 [Lichtheimia corymbifera JMRC:FSU:9682]|uniref:Uncharacterized protein n=1 Tax=Lichtheimia corymbifera JMRC:FSU:9682 TaxID=1263082 RepID=A0A068REH4_9FUNG|nr:hypothetical protein RO3G_13478 [Lichtheimia corymbifera JMRC:FSU:9682]